MAAKNYYKMASEILSLVGGKENVLSHTNCVTRLRITVSDAEIVNVDELSALPYVLKVQLVAGIYQIVLGPGVVDSVRKEFNKIVGNTGDVKIDEKVEGDNVKKSLGQSFVAMMQAIIMPTLPALLAAALVLAFLNVLKLLGIPADSNMYFLSLSVFGGVAMKSLGVLFAINTARYFGGNMYLSAFFAMLIVSENSIASLELFGEPLKQGVGGIIGIVLMAIALSYIEKALTKVVPKTLYMLVVPFVTALITMALLLVLIIPVSDFLTSGLVSMFTFLSNGSAITMVIGSVLIAGLWPALVLSGLHQSILAVLLVIYNETGHTPFVAAAWLGGAAQIGTAIAIYILFRKTDKSLKEIITAGVPAGSVGVIEPLMYGINLPRVRPFFIAMCCAAVGGLIIGLTGIQQQYGLSGIVGMLSFDTFGQSLTYGIVWVGTVIFSCVVCLISYKVKGEK